MSKRDYERLSIEAFGKHLLESGDLDPIYIALRNTFVHGGGSIPALHRWLVAYWCLYHAGAASYLSGFEGHAFWAGLHLAARNDLPAPTGERWPRGHERRHFRGQAAVKAVRTMSGRYLEEPEQLVRTIIRGSAELDPCSVDQRCTPLPFQEVAERAQDLPLFGPWIGFKIGDMIDRVLGIPVSFENGAVFMFDDPTKAALRVWRLKAGYPEPADKKAPRAMPKDKDKAITEVVNYLIARFSAFRAPPLYDRAVGLQEVETILCKWKSHMNGHYPLYNDIDEISEGVKPWIKHSPTAQTFAMCMPPNPLRASS